MTEKLATLLLATEGENIKSEAKASAEILQQGKTDRTRGDLHRSRSVQILPVSRTIHDFSLFFWLRDTTVAPRKQLNKEGWIDADGFAFERDTCTHLVRLARLAPSILG